MLAESGVVTAPVPPDSSYLGELSDTAQRAFLELLASAGKLLGLSGPVVLGIAAVLVLVAVLLVGRRVLARVRSAARPEPGAVTAGEGPAPAPRDAAAWRAELERRLAAGSIPEALEAAWWWLARTLAGETAEPDWTSRDLMSRSRRPDLLPLVRRLDAFLYGPRRPAVEELRALVGRMEEALS